MKFVEVKKASKRQTEEVVEGKTVKSVYETGWMEEQLLSSFQLGFSLCRQS